MKEMETKQAATENVNSVTLQGLIIHAFQTDKVTILTIHTGNTTPVPNYPKVVFFGNPKKDADTYKVGDRVRITGNIQSSKRDPKIKNQVRISIFGESIEPAATQLEKFFGVKGNFAVPENHFELSGRVLSIDVPSRNIVRMTVKSVKNRRQSFVSLVYFTKSPEKVLTEILPGDDVYILGSIQTNKVVKDETTRHFQNYVIAEIKKA